MQRYITSNWVQQTNVNLNTKIYLRNEINFMPAHNKVPKEPGRLLAKLQGNTLDATKTIEESSLVQRVCNPTEGIQLGGEGGVLKGWKLQGIIVVTRHGDRGPMVHVRDADSVDCGAPKSGK